MKHQATAERWGREANKNPPPAQPAPGGPVYHHIDVERIGEVFLVRLREQRMDEAAILEMAKETVQLITDEGCRKLILSLGPDTPELLYSVFLAKLVMIRRRLLEHGGVLKLCDLTPQCRDVFEACQLSDYFDFAPDTATAIAALAH